ncbi:MAG: hypothetical protein Q9223_005750 [Gallowayella weberi]
MDFQPPSRDQILVSNATSGSVIICSFDIHKPSRLSRNLVICDADDKTVAYNVIVSASPPLSKTPNLYIYHGRQQANSSTNGHADSQLAQTPLATSKLSQYSGSFSMIIRDRTIDVPSRTLGWYKFDHEWPSTQGIMRWKHGKYGMAMQLLDHKKTLLGEVEVDGGRDGRKGRLWVRAIGGDKDKEWVDEVVCVAVGVLLVKPTKM